MNYVMQNTVFEWTLAAQKAYQDPFNDVTLDAVVSGPDGQTQTVPAFWAGEKYWKVRFASSVPGTFHLRSVCGEQADAGLHGCATELTIIPYQGDNPLYRHGPLRIAADGHHLSHADGTPFFWLADTWWMGLTKRLTWPVGFQTLALDRWEKGFNVVQIVAGLYPDMEPFDPRGANEAGFPWTPDYASINPDYFRMADRRIRYLVETGLMPCIVGCWGYFLPLLGIANMQKHWRYLVARYGAYPVVWCLAGEGQMPFYLAEHPAEDSKLQKRGWTELGAYLRQIDPFHRLVTIHDGTQNVEDPAVLDFDLLQTGHGDRLSLPNTTEMITERSHRQPPMPVINGEVCYEGIGESCRQEVQRMMFWTCLLSGAAGHTYGANGIWQVNTREKPFGPSPHGLAWGNTPWEDAYQLPGSAHVGLGKRVLERYPWWRFESHPEWVEPHWTKENYFGAYAAGIPRELRVIYFPGSWFVAGKVAGVEPDVAYRATLINPATGEETALGLVTPDEQGIWVLPLPGTESRMMPIYQDWVLVLDARTPK